jgi:hypothetical protein
VEKSQRSGSASQSRPNPRSGNREGRRRRQTRAAHAQSALGDRKTARHEQARAGAPPVAIIVRCRVFRPRWTLFCGCGALVSSLLSASAESFRAEAPQRQLASSQLSHRVPSHTSLIK